MASPPSRPEKASWEDLLRLELLWDKSGPLYSHLDFVMCPEAAVFLAETDEDKQLAAASPHRFWIKRNLPLGVPYIDAPDDKIGELFKKALEHGIFHAADQMISKRQKQIPEERVENSVTQDGYEVVETAKSKLEREISLLEKWKTNPSLVSEVYLQRIAALRAQCKPKE